MIASFEPIRVRSRFAQEFNFFAACLAQLVRSGDHAGAAIIMSGDRPVLQKETKMKNRTVLLAVPALMFATSTFAADYPDVKAGLWSTTATNADARMPPQSGTMCTSNDVIRALADMQRGKTLPCKVLSRTQSGSTYTSETECSFGGTVRKTTSVTTATGNTALHTEIHGSDGALVMTNDMKYVGACPAGMVPGDFTGANGMHYNVLHAGAAPGAPAPPH